MNDPIHALLTTLKWKQQDLCNQLLCVEKKLQRVEQDIQVNQQQTQESLTISGRIIPEQEIARGCFLMTQQAYHQQLTNNKTALQSDQHALITQQTHLNTTLKILEKREKTNARTKQQHLLRHEQNRLDEWSIQRRSQHEN